MDGRGSLSITALASGIQALLPGAEMLLMPAERLYAAKCVPGKCTPLTATYRRYAICSSAVHIRYSCSTLQKAPTSWTFPGVPRCLLGCAHFPGAVGRFPAWERVLGTDLKTSVNYAPSICRGFLWPIYVPPMRGCKDMKCGGLYPTHCPPRSHAVVPGIPGAPGNSSSAQ